MLIALIKKVKNSAKPIKTWFGGAVCVPIAVLRKCNDTNTPVKDVSIIKIDGANDNIVNISNIRMDPDNVPSSLL